MKRRDLQEKLRALGWRLVRHGARHDVWSAGDREIAVPTHNEINEYVGKAILKEAGGDRS